MLFVILNIYFTNNKYNDFISVPVGEDEIIRIKVLLLPEKLEPVSVEDNTTLFFQ